MCFDKWVPASTLVSKYTKESPKLQTIIGADDINQGALGDCYQLSAIASLTETETRAIGGDFNKVVSKLMMDNTPELNSSGIQVFNIFIDGEFYPVKINELIPSKDNDYV